MSCSAYYYLCYLFIISSSSSSNRNSNTTNNTNNNYNNNTDAPSSERFDCRFAARSCPDPYLSREAWTRFLMDYFTGVTKEVICCY